jgi:hypothetical protein
VHTIKPQGSSPGAFLLTLRNSSLRNSLPADMADTFHSDNVASPSCATWGFGVSN